MEIGEALSPIREKLNAMDERIRNIELNMVKRGLFPNNLFKQNLVKNKNKPHLRIPVSGSFLFLIDFLSPFRAPEYNSPLKMVYV